MPMTFTHQQQRTINRLRRSAFREGFVAGLLVATAIVCVFASVL